MTNIIDITDILKKNAEDFKGIPEFYSRFTACYKRQLETGKCDCDFCATKTKMMDSILNYAQDLAIEQMKLGKHTIYYGDMLEIFIMASLKLKEFCHTEHKG